MAKPEAVEKLYTDYLRDVWDTALGFAGKWHAKMPRDGKLRIIFDEFHPIGRSIL